MTLLNMKSLIKACSGALLGAVLLFSQSASAVIIEYDLIDLGGGDFMYEYFVFNDDMTEGIDGITVFFEPFEIDESSVVMSAPPLWTTFLFPGDPFFGAGLDFYVDFAIPIGLGESLGGFSASFTWTGGPSGPGDQFFEAYSLEVPSDPFSAFNAFVDGFTVAAPPPPPPPGVPEPSTISLLLLSVLAWFSNRRKMEQ